MPPCSSRRLFQLSLLLFALLIASPAWPRDGETDHLEGEARAIADWLIDGQRAGWEDHDVEKYLAQWHDDAVLILARAEKPGEFDLRVTMDQLEPTRRLRMHGPSSGRTLAMSDIDVSVMGDKATVNWRCISASEDQTSRELMRERYQLTRTDDGWKVIENRTWFIGLEEDDKRTVLDNAYWALHDMAAERGMQANDPRRQRQALFEGYRFAEAHDAAVKATQRDDATLDDWLWRGIIAAIAYRPEDAKMSFRKAIEIDPDTWLPSYAIESDWIKE